MSTRTLAKSGAVSTKLKTGTYTGDGNATQAITGVGFQPKYVLINRQLFLKSSVAQKNNQDALLSDFYWSGGAGIRYLPSGIISLDIDGFTVGNTPDILENAFNLNLALYTYVCFG